MKDAPAPQAVRYEFPSSYAQRRIWFIQQMEPESPTYNVPWFMRLTGDLQFEALERCLDEIVRRHEVLRTTFPAREGEPVQQVHPVEKTFLPLVDLAGLGARERAAAARALRGRESRCPFDLTRGPVFRTRLLRLGAGEHELLVTLHHIVSDAWSKGILARELFALYDAFRRGLPAPLPKPALQQADFAVWQREWLKAPVFAQQLEYWTERLRGVPPLEVPADFVRPPSTSWSGAVVGVAVPRGVSARLQELRRSEGATSFIVLLAAFQWLLGLHADQDDVAVGTVIASRRRKDTQDLVGCLLNTLVLRADLSGAPSFRELIGRVRRRAVEAYAHEDLPFDRLVEVLAPRRTRGRTPLFQAAFAVETGERAALRLHGLQVEDIDAELERAKFELMLMLAETPDGIRGELQYAADLYARESMERLVRNFERLLDVATVQPDAPLPSLSLLDDEGRRFVRALNRTERAFPRERAVHELFEAQAAAHPDALAVAHRSVRLTYGELDRQANQLARHLRARGVGPEVRVGVSFDRGVDMVVGLLATLKAGGAYVPLDPGYPMERLAYMVEDAGIGLLLTEEAFRGRFWDAAAETVCVEDVRAELARLSPEALPCRNTGDGLAYVMYTSGSTGTPKGIMVPHRAITRLVVNSDYVELRAGDRIAQVSNASFDAATFEIWGALLNGAALVVIDKEIAVSPVELGRNLAREQVTVMFLTTALFNQAAREAQDVFKALRCVLFGGEAVDPRRVHDVLQRDAPGQLQHVYGPTETTTFATWFPVRDVDPRRHTVPIGHPIANTSVYVLDAGMQPVPPGVPGEVYIGGPGVARGYWRKPGLTAERFVPDPFAGGGERLYRTGDKARYRDDGAVEFLGRVDDQIKLRGYRIEVGEITAALRQNDAVKDAVVVVREEQEHRRLVGYVVPKPDAEIRVSAIKEALKSRLPEYMVPADFVVLPELPLTANGKIDRAALPDPLREGQGLHEYVAPLTELERALCLIWAETLQVERVGTADNFFDLGGHSLLATRVLSRVKSELGVEVPLRTLFENPTVAEFARAAGASLAVETAVAIPRVSRDGALALSAAQRRLWFLHQMQPDSGAYNVPLFLRLTGGLDRGALEWSLGEIERRHEVLRTHFPLHQGEPVQHIEPARPVEVPLVDLSALGAEPRAQAARELRLEEANRPYDLERGPVWRARLLRLDETEHELLLTVHHVATDGWSQGILVTELRTLYAARLAGSGAPLPEPALQYADFAAWQESWLKGEVLERQLAYWRARLDGVPVLDLPADRPRVQVAGHPQASRPMRLSPQATEALKRLSQRENATLFMALLAGFQWLLSRYARQADVAVGTVVANRNRRDVEDLVGFFVNTLVLRTDVSAARTFRQLLGRVKEAALEAYAHQDLPFEKLVEELNPPRDLGRTPFFQALLVLQNVPVSSWDLPGLRVEDVSVELREAKFEMNFILAEHNSGVEGRLGYAADLFDAESIDQLLRHYVRLLEQAAADPDGALAALPLLEEDERRRIVVEWNRTAAPPPQDGLALELFAAQVRRAPHAVAVQFEGTRLTYAELDERSNRLARHLLERGLGPEARVGVGLERGIEWAVTILAVWKAGAAYVPLDSAYPKERLAYMLEDAAVGVVVTDLAMLDELPPHPVLVCVDRDWESIEQHGGGELRPDLRPDSLAYVMFTSGSTGKPKGVMIEHGGMVNHLWAKVGDLGIGAHDVVAQNARASFDISVWQLFAPLIVGGQAEIFGEELSRDGFQHLGEVQRLGVTVLETVPSLLAVMIEQEERRGAQRVVLDRLRCVVSNAEALPVNLCERWARLYPEVRLVNTFGATETSDDVTHVTLGPSQGGGSPYAPLGTPLPNLAVYVLDAELQPVPFGVAGELCVGGVGVGRGYLNRPALTAQRFVPDPFGALPGRRLYRTGDLARLNRDRTLEFLGRTDFQVKLRGHRVELGEIEGAVMEHDDVSQAVVLVREDAPGSQRLVGYVVPTSAADAGALPAKLAAFLDARLPEYMLPAAYVVLESMPLTVNGKVDWRALPPPEGGAENADTYVAPRNEIETMLCELWARLLQVPRVGIHDNFFGLGGHSLLATQVISQLRSELDTDVPLAAVFRSPTVAAFAQELERARTVRRPAVIAAADRSAFRNKA